MTSQINFVRMRLRNASVSELLYRIRKMVISLYLKWSTKLGFRGLRTPNIEKAEIEKLVLPDLTPDPENRLYHGLCSTDLKLLLCTELSRPIAAQTDIRLRWEPARLQQAVVWLVLADQNRDGLGWEKPKQAAKELVLSWIDANPFPLGVHYQSAMECAMRIPVFFMAIKGVDGLTPDESAMLLTAIYRHGWLISKQLSLYSSLGNHTIAEGVGLIFAGAVYRSTRRGNEWLTTGIKLLGEELNHQILDDGGPAEQSLSYHRFVLDLYWLAVDFIQKNNLGNVDHWEPRLTAGESFLRAFQDQGGNFPAIGDGDDGFGVAPGISPARFPGPAVSETPITFADSGYSIIRTDKLVFTFDHGLLGLAPFYNHGHADALSVTLSKNGCPLLVDPGTYRYNGVPRWRRYFKGTRAHNTVTIDDQDQALQETSFIWSKPYNAKLTVVMGEKDERFYSATHDGYARLVSPVWHKRSVLFFDGENFLIRDRFVGSGIHDFELNFHLHPDATVENKGAWWTVGHAGQLIFFRPIGGIFKSVRGRYDQPLGWFSSHYGEKEPTTVLSSTKRGVANDIAFVTGIYTRSPF